MNKLCPLLLVCALDELSFGQTNAPLAALDLFKMPQPALRAGTAVAEQMRTSTAIPPQEVFGGDQTWSLTAPSSAPPNEPHSLRRPTFELTASTGTNINSITERPSVSSNEIRQDFLTEEFSARLSGTEFDLQLYKRLEQGGYLTRPEPPSDNLLIRAGDSIFRPEVFHIRKVAVSCSLLTAIKRKNPLCLLNPIFLNASW